MEKYDVLPEDIERVSEQQVIRKNKVSMVAIGLILLAILLAVGGFSATDPNSSVATFLYTAALFVFFAGIVKFCMGRNCYFFKPTGSQIRQVTLYFDNKERHLLQDYIENKNFDALTQLKRQINTGVKVEAMVAADNRFVAVQLSEYVPYTYEAVTPVMCYYEEDARRLTDYFRKNR